MPRLVFLLCMALLTVPLRAGEIGLIKPGAEWRYMWVMPGLDFTGWTTPDYNDTGWYLRPGGFYSRFGNVPGGAEATWLPTGDDYWGYVYRRRFNVADKSYIKRLVLRIDYEHGFVAYLNGVEVARRGFPDLEGSPVPLNAFAAFHQRGPTELIELDTTALRDGQNAFCVQVHRASLAQRDFCFVAELMANFSRAPMVTKTSRASNIITWNTATASHGRVEFGKSMEALRIVSSPTPGTRHEVELTDLEPGTTYHYRVWIAQNDSGGASDWSTFQTLKPTGQPIRFAVVGDTGQGMPVQQQVADGIAAQDPDLVMHVGDVVYPYFTRQHADSRHFSVNRDLLARRPMFAVTGNHDGLGIHDFNYDFILPTNNGTENLFREAYYSFDHGDAHFVVVATDTYIGCEYHPDSEQYRWLEADLASSTQPWKFLFFHHVLRTSALHRYDDYLHDGVIDMFALRENVGALAARYGAQIIFNGHDHDYERFALFDGVSSFISGGGGASLYGREYNEPGSEIFLSRHHFLLVEIEGSQLVTKAIASNGEVLDRYYRSIAAPSATSYASSWGTPIVENSFGADGDGNIAGQTFDFEGEAIPTLAGLRANLGRLHVRNDATHLYVGFEQASIHPDQAIALFLENPLQPGVSDIGALGNGEFDEDGVDGLDALTNLRLLNFRPSVAALLGEEMADTHLRNMRRPQVSWGIGQGVFRLDESFTTIAEARLQQFNRSPQAGVQTWEQNADLIEVSIPLSALGSPRHPNSIRLGAIAIAAAAEELAVRIDTAVAGRSLAKTEAGVATLEPITIQLAADSNVPNDPHQFSGRLLASTRILFSWRSIKGKRYHIQATPDLSEPFANVTAVGLPMMATGSSATFTLDVPPGSRTMFYRLSELP